MVSGRPGAGIPASSGGRGPNAAQEVPRVDGALTVPPRVRAVPPQRIGVVQSPPASAEAPRSSPCRRCWPGPGRYPIQALAPAGKGRGGGLGSPGAAAQHWPPGGGRQTRFGCGRGGCVVASLGSVCCPARQLLKRRVQIERQHHHRPPRGVGSELP